MNNVEQSHFHFSEISPDLILDALMEAGIYPESGLTELNSYENRVYQFQDENRKRFVVKFYRPERWNRSQIQEEHDFTLELQDAELPVAAPLEFAGQTVLEFGGFMFAIFPSIGGRQYEADNLFQLEEVGRLLGRTHQIGKKSTFMFRPTLGVTEYLDQPRQIMAQTELIAPKWKETFLESLDKLIAQVKKDWPVITSPLRLQGDCHPGNILWRDEAWLVDFDDARNGPAVQDLWMLLNGSRQEQVLQLDTLLEAYNEFCDFDVKELKLIEPLRAMRMVHYLGWIIRRWQDPAFPRAFSWIREDDFWQRQSIEFAQQLERLQEPPLQLAPQF
ncbi:serine/threonine protein kinase [Providencia stuartii]|uniref:serine/threonine protein kinase n=1 Tax=Providencia TaxID=586 RepID=UPI0027FA7585|nr:MULTISPECIES: serine/threonine protein kinase [Providencia]ELR5299882.1 serine/threonine protein kinase [Providencia stuartii]MDW7589106.1 serine/threonine protein kinase [Providencia sp. 2023EL-00965]MDX4946609.1 serine/threonine protein kinase [Providencia manganoxydans]HEF8771303.1 serine/threonine protein kinase [Providencia stuartii]